jgi:UDP-GlcNAc:undecaprenyl-phosphate/decaprenyl-phosphate GlcNAc-1-phosphate transferase
VNGLAFAGYFFAAFAMSALLTPVCRRVALGFGLVAAPRADRWHQRPTALLGGVAVALPVLALTPSLWRLNGLAHLMVCGAFIAVFGVLDDVFSVKPTTKLIAQIIAASGLLFFGYRIGWTTSLIADSMLTLAWVVAVTNAFNLLDNMDGLCAGITAIAASFMALAVVESAGVTPLALYLATLIGASLGFLLYNFQPASIFMGDAGSLFLGLNMAAVTLMFQTDVGRSSVLSVVAGPLLLMLIPILDSTLVTVARLLSGRAISKGGRDHTSHRLVAIGLSQRMAVGVLWTLAALGGSLALLAGRRDASWFVIALGLFALAVGIFGVYLARVQVYHDADFSRLREKGITPLVFNLMYKRRIAEVLLDFCLIPLAYYTAYRFRFEGELLFANYGYFIQSLPLVLACQLVALFTVGGYRGTWRLFGMMDAVVFAKGVLLGTVAAQLGILYIYRYEHYSRTVFFIYATVLMLLLAGTRASFRLISEFVSRRMAGGRRCVIYGTGTASLATIREAFGHTPLRLLGFIDDDPMQRNGRVAGYPVLGGFEDLRRMLESAEIDCVVLNSRLIDAHRLQRLEVECLQHGIELLRLHVHLKPVSAVS